MKLVMQAVAEGYLGQLVDEVVESYEADSLTMTQIVTALLALQKQTPPITVGTIEPTVSRSIKIEGDTIARALLKLRDTHGGYLEVDSNLALNWWDSVGEDKGQQIRYKKNLIGITRERNYQGTCQKIFAYGAGEGDARIQLDDLLVEDEEATKDEDVTYGYLTLGGLYSCYKNWTAAGGALPAEMIIYEDDVDVSADWTQGANERTLRCAILKFDNTATYTVTYRHATYLWDGTTNPLVRVHIDRRVTHPDTLIAWGRLYLTETKDPITTYDIDAFDLSASGVGGYDFIFEDLQLGSVVTVIDEDLGIDLSTRVVRLSNSDLSHPEKLTIELSTTVKDLADVLADIYDIGQLNQHIATKIGAGNVIVKGVFTVIDWVTEGETTIDGSNITTGTLTADKIAAGTIESKIIIIKGADGILRSDDYEADAAGWIIRGDGYAEFNEVKIRGTLYTTVIAGGNVLTVTGSISAVGGDVIIDGSGITLKDSGYLRQYDGVTLRGTLGLYSDGVVLQGNSEAYLKSSAGTYYIKVASGEIRLSATNTDITGDFDPTSVGSQDIGNATYYYYRIYTNIIYRNYEYSFQHLDDIALIRQMKEDPNNLGFIDKKTMPAILMIPPGQVRAEEKARALAEKSKVLAEIAQSSLDKFHKKEAITQVKARCAERIAHMNSISDDDLCNINAFAEIDLALGAIRRVADRLDDIDAKLAGLGG